MNHTQIPVIKSTELRDGITTVVGVITADLLVNLARVPERNHLKKTGYQRKASLPRVRRLANELAHKKVDLPTAILCNIRDIAPADLLTRHEDGDTYMLNLDADSHKGKDLSLYIVDGQHRMKALEEAMQNGIKLHNFKVPFVCMLGADENKEMEQFHVVNSNAKSVPTDLALELLRARADNNPAFLDDIIKAGKKWQIEAERTTENLAKHSQIWKDRIRMPNMPKANTTIGSASMVRSLGTLFRHATIFSAIKDEQQQVQIIDAYWQGIRSILRDPFDLPKDYSIQKGVGVRVLHGILPIVVEHVRSKGDSIYSKEAYAVILEDLLTEDLEGPNGVGAPVSGEAFWRSGKEGAIGTYSSEAGIHALIETMKTLLPELEAE